MPDRQKAVYNTYRNLELFFFSFSPRNQFALLMMINDDDDDDDVYTLHTRGQSTCEDSIPLARSRKKKKEIEGKKDKFIWSRVKGKGRERRERRKMK